MRNLLYAVLAAIAAGCGTSTLELEKPTGEVSSLSGPTDGGPIFEGPGLPPDAPECQPGEVAPCESSCGSTGTRPCTSGRWAASCDVPLEHCGGGIDEDCDTKVDGLDPDCQACVPAVTRVCITSCGSKGTGRCGSDGQWESSCLVPAEVCGNGVDDDCDGQSDSTDSNCWVCTPGQSKPCTTSCGSGGSQRCSTGQWEPTCTVPAEACGNGVDDDCDGKVDSTDTDCQVCTPGQSKPCTTSCGGSGGRKSCSTAGQWEASCVVPAEVCGNGLDDDCDGQPDSTDSNCWVCTPSQTRPCSTSCGSGGSQRCATTGQWESTCRPPVEVCGNTVDDDCDGQPDATDSNCWVCTPGQTRPCSATCGSGGTQRCATTGQWETTCRPPTESCDNGVDDDCDGKVDHQDPECPEIVHTCESTEGGGCNGDLGYGDRCAASENTGGCSSGRFWAWCNRRNPQYPNIWDNWIKNWVDSRCDGAMAETGTQYSTWYCTSSTNDRYECTTPLVLSFDGAPIALAGPDAQFSFAPGQPVHSSWPRPATPWLVRDVNQNGRIDDGSELFGSNTRLPDGTLAANGFAALTALDRNRDGVLDVFDTAFASLRLWSDLDGDRRSGPGEVKTLRSAGVTSLSLQYAVAPRCDRDGNCEGERASFRWTNKEGRLRTGALVDLYLATARAPLLSCLEPGSKPSSIRAAAPRD